LASGLLSFIPNPCQGFAETGADIDQANSLWSNPAADPAKQHSPVGRMTAKFSSGFPPALGIGITRTHQDRAGTAPGSVRYPSFGTRPGRPSSPRPEGIPHQSRTSLTSQTTHTRREACTSQTSQSPIETRSNSREKQWHRIFLSSPSVLLHGISSSKRINTENCLFDLLDNLLKQNCGRTVISYFAELSLKVWKPS
jgi:hypothetical protein